VKVLPNAVTQLLAAALVVLGAAIFTAAFPRGDSQVRFGGRQQFLTQAKAQQSSDSKTKRNARPDDSTQSAGPVNESKPIAEPALYSYEFTQPEFYNRHIVIEHDADGRGHIRFERLHEDTPITEPVELSAAALSRTLALWQELRFLDSQENYQSERQFPHLGTMRLRMEQGGRKRTAEFNWTHNRGVSALVDEYRRLADQAMFVFDISIARQNQPLNGPKLLEGLESLLKRGGLSDPQQVIPLLKDISTDERLPLIARNHAIRLLKKIEK